MTSKLPVLRAPIHPLDPYPLSASVYAAILLEGSHSYTTTKAKFRKGERGVGNRESEFGKTGVTSLALQRNPGAGPHEVALIYLLPPVIARCMKRRDAASPLSISDFRIPTNFSFSTFSVVVVGRYRLRNLYFRGSKWIRIQWDFDAHRPGCGLWGEV